MQNNEFLKAIREFKSTPKRIFSYVKYSDNGEIVEICSEEYESSNAKFIKVDNTTLRELQKYMLSDWQVNDNKLQRKIKTFNTNKNYPKIKNSTDNEIGTECVDGNFYWPKQKIKGKGLIFSNE
jgi:hypothetical protein